LVRADFWAGPVAVESTRSSLINPRGEQVRVADGRQLRAGSVVSGLTPAAQRGERLRIVEVVTHEKLIVTAQLMVNPHGEFIAVGVSAGGVNVVQPRIVPDWAKDNTGSGPPRPY